MSASRIGEREAPDGEEEEATPVQAASAPSGLDLAAGDVRIPAWIGNPPVSTLTVLFKDRALEQLQQLGTEVSFLIYFHFNKLTVKCGRLQCSRRF